MAGKAWRLRITIDGRTYDATVEDLDEGADAPAGAVPAPERPAVPPAARPDEGPPSPAPARAGEVRAPLPGVVTELRCRAGHEVRAGQVLLVLEAMKMDNEIAAPRAGTLRELRVARGDQVEAGQVLAVVG